MAKIGFFLNHYDLHQVPHIVPYAFELSRDHDDMDVAILCSTREEEEFARKIGYGYPGNRCSFELLEASLWVDLVDPLVSKFAFARKQSIMDRNIAKLAQFDILVVPEMTSLKLKRIPGLEKVKIVFTGHGAGDNRTGGSYSVRIGQFDLCLMPGRKYADGLREVGYLPDDRYGIAGYPKFEAVNHLISTGRQLFKNDRPVVVYNPHHLPRYTSWTSMGEQVLDFFYDSKDYNLIFSPHVLLFRRPMTKGAKFPRKYKSTTNVLIDTGSRSSVDMTYLRSADIYLGDVSSQIYEFLETPRPCIFLDAHDVDWENDPSYLQWTFGKLLGDPADLGAALDSAFETHPDYLDAQKFAFERTFSTSNRTAGARGAEIIAEFARTGKIDPKWL
ncbi:MAG: hypothetical protein ACR2OR_16880 [Hyphomicrobiales bacterium]